MQLAKRVVHRGGRERPGNALKGAYRRTASHFRCGCIGGQMSLCVGRSSLTLNQNGFGLHPVHITSRLPKCSLNPSSGNRAPLANHLACRSRAPESIVICTPMHTKAQRRRPLIGSRWLVLLQDQARLGSPASPARNIPRYGKLQHHSERSN